MRKAAKARNDVAVHHGIALRLDAERRVKFQRAILLPQLFAMHKRQIQEAAQRRINDCVETKRNRLFRDAQRLQIGREHPSGATKTVTRILIQQNHQRQRALSRGRPHIKRAARGSLVLGCKFRTKFIIKCRVFLEPATAPCLSPEFDDGGRRKGCTHDLLRLQPSHFSARSTY